MKMKYLAVCCDSNLDIEAVKRQHPDAVLHVVNTSDSEAQIDDEIDMVLLDYLHSSLKLAFVGGDQAKKLAEGYGATWIRETTTTTEDLLRYWKTPTDEDERLLRDSGPLKPL